MRRILLLCLCFFALMASAQDIFNKGATKDLEQFVGLWHPNNAGWHGDISITTDGSKLYLTMTTDEGKKRFDEVEINYLEPSIEWSYKEESEALWYIAKWHETNREEIMVDVNHIHGSCGVPTEIYHRGVEANHSVKEWKYFAVVVDGKLIISYAYQWDFFAPSNETVFMKFERFLSALTYRKDI